MMIVGSEPLKPPDEMTPLLSGSQSSSQQMSGPTKPSSMGMNIGILPDLDEVSHTSQMRPFGLSGIAEKQEDLSPNGTGQELALQDNIDAQAQNEEILKPTTSQKG